MRVGISISHGLYSLPDYDRIERIEWARHRGDFLKLEPARSMYIPLTKNSPQHWVLKF